MNQRPRVILGSPGFLTDLSKETQFSDAWLLLASVAAIVGLLTHRPALIFVGAFIFAISLVSLAWDAYSTRDLVFRRHLSEQRAFMGEELEMTIEVENRKWLPLSWIRVTDIVATGLSVSEVEEVDAPDRGTSINAFFSLRWLEAGQRRFHILCNERGFFPLGPARVETGDPFGFFSRTWQETPNDAVIVYPKILPVTDFSMTPKEPMGALTAEQPLFEDPGRTIGPRDYRPEDSFRRIHWPATARRGTLQSRILEPTTEHNLALFLDVTTLPRPYQGTVPEWMERAVTVTASIASYASERRWPVGLVSNGTIPRSDQSIKLSPSRSPYQLIRIMETLAVVMPIANDPIEKVLASASPQLPWGATLAVIVSVVSETLLSTLVRLQRAGRRVVLIITSDASMSDLPPIPILQVVISEMEDQITLEPVILER